MSSQRPFPYAPFPEFNVKMPDFDWAEIFGGAKLPTLNPEKVIEAHRRNLEAWTRAQQVMSEGFQSIGHRQSEIMGAAMGEATALMKTLSEPKTLDAKTQANAMKTAIDHQLAHVKEMAELIAKVQGDAFAILRERLLESLEEARAIGGEKPAPKAEAASPTKVVVKPKTGRRA